MSMAEKKYTSMLRVRMSAKDAHYGGNLVDGAHMVHLFGDVATELLIKTDGDEGLFCAYNNVEFKAPVYAGDYIEVYGEVTHIGNTSRKMRFEARKVIATRPDISASSCHNSYHPFIFFHKIWMAGFCPAGFPHSEICGSMDICSSPQLIAAYHVFRRLLVPRHPPCALFVLDLAGA